ncbi:MAG: exodeoxyribonuclease VII large subunit [Desulfobacterales bacterium]|nr:exodeoxyribonuclease VII large subunit [Desulfobacterales bacterium]
MGTTMSRRIYTVSELTRNIKALLEENFPFTWISGEISNLRIPASGHCYLTLKDDAAQISAVIFKGQKRQMGFDIQDGMAVTGLGRLSVYPPRGAYQIILEYLEPAGLGVLQAAFDQLKRRLADEGLFDPTHKRSLPFLPKKIAVITSATGAVLHDIITVTKRRFSNLAILIIPVPVQGHEAPQRIAEAIEQAHNTRHRVDVIILARGGGSFEDLQPFNTEIVARAIFASRIPVVSAVGHETDVTIADFVADVRAPTPSAAAEVVIPVKSDLKHQCTEAASSLQIAMLRILDGRRQRLADLRRRRIDPRSAVQAFRLRLDDVYDRVFKMTRRKIDTRRERLAWMGHRLRAANPAIRAKRLRERLLQLQNELSAAVGSQCYRKAARRDTLCASLAALNPTAILSRGYSITRRLPDMAVVREPDSVVTGQDLEITLACGKLRARVTAAKETAANE